MLIVHDYAYDFGGGERVTAALAVAFPKARVLAVGGMDAVFERMGILGRVDTVLPRGRLEGSYRILAPLMPRAVGRTVDDIVVSSSYAFAHHVRSRTLHVEYCHSPLRQLWIAEDRYLATSGVALRTGMRVFGAYVRRADRAAVSRVDVIVSSCENVRQRVRAVYGRESEVVYPPVSLEAFSPAPVERERDLVVLVGRLVEPYKQVRSALQAFRGRSERLVLVGGGRDAAVLQAAAPPNVTFAGRADDAELRQWYSKASVVLFPSDDDFGIVPVEAMACGTPVIALDAGGARETVIHGVTGLRYREPASLSATLDTALSMRWDHEAIRRRAFDFDTAVFVERMQRIVWTAEGRRKQTRDE